MTWAIRTNHGISGDIDVFGCFFFLHSCTSNSALNNSCLCLKQKGNRLDRQNKLDDQSLHFSRWLNLKDQKVALINILAKKRGKFKDAKRIWHNKCCDALGVIRGHQRFWHRGCSKRKTSLRIHSQHLYLLCLNILILQSVGKSRLLSL